MEEHENQPECWSGTMTMGAEIIQFDEFKARKDAAGLANEPAVLHGAPDLADRFHFWCGASGRRYVHTVYSLVECPALPSGNYILVKRDDNGAREVLAIGSVANDAASLNLAEIRRRGAELGANEVHVHLLASTTKLSKLVEFDLKSCAGAPAAANQCH